MTLVYPTFILTRRGDSRTLTATAEVESDPTGAVAVAALCRRVTGEMVVDDLAAVAEVTGAGPYVLTLTCDLAPAGPLARPGFHFLRYVVTFPGGDVLTVPADNTMCVYLT